MLFHHEKAEVNMVILWVFFFNISYLDFLLAELVLLKSGFLAPFCTLTFVFPFEILFASETCIDRYNKLI